MKRFAKGEALTAADMNQLAVAIESVQDTPRGGQQARQAHATYGMAWYTPAGSSTASSTDGALEAAGLVASVDFNTEARSPRIDNGGIQLPYANYGLSNTDDNAGGIAGIRYGSGIDAPRINGGMIELVPGGSGGGGECSCVLAQYAAPGVADVAGKIAGVHFSSGVDAPRISDGVMMLPLAEYEPADSNTDEVRVAGGIMGVAYASGIDTPRIATGGRIELPTGMVGVMTSAGVRTSWHGLPNTLEYGMILSTHYVGSYKYDLRAWSDGKYLGLAIVQDYNFTSV